MLYPVLPPTPSTVVTYPQANVNYQHLANQQQSLIKQPQTTTTIDINGGNAISFTGYNLDNYRAKLQVASLSNQAEFLVEFLTGNSADPELPILAESLNWKDYKIWEHPLFIKNINPTTEELISTKVAVVPKIKAQSVEDITNKPESSSETSIKSNNDIKLEESNNSSKPEDKDSSVLTQNLKSKDGKFLVGVIINNTEVDSLDIRIDNDLVLVPLEDFADITGFTVEIIDGVAKLKTPLGVVDIAANNLKQIDGIIYISEATLKEKLSTLLKLNAANLALIVDVPWRRGGDESPQQAAALQPEFLPPISGLSSFRQELQITNSSGDTNLRSSTLLGGRLAGGSWRVRFNNNFVNQPDISEYFFYKRSNQVRYQIGRQQIGLHPLLNGMNFTGAQIGYSNLPADRFGQQYSAAELLPRRSRPLQTFRGQVPSASFVQLRVSGVIIAQQQVGLNGIYEFVDVNLPTGNNNDIELLIFDRNNLSVPSEIRSLRINASDLLLAAGGNVQLGGLGISGNLVQDSLFENSSSESGKLVGFYQLRQGLSDNLTFEGSVQAIPGTLQTQAGFIWRFANPAILATSVGTSRGQVGYTTNLDVNFGKLEILGNSELFPTGYKSDNQSRDRYNHSLETSYKFSNDFQLGFIARYRQDENDRANYILPTFSLNPMRHLSFRGRPDLDGRYLFSSYYYPNSSTRLAFNTLGDIYTSDLTYSLNQSYQLSFGGEFGGDLAPRYSARLNYNSRNLSSLSWNVGLAYSNGDVGPVVGASMQVLPGLFARAEYQSIPSRARSILGGFGDDRLTVLLVSDLSFAGGAIAPANSYSVGQDRGAIAGRIVIEGANKDFDLGGAYIQVLDSRNNRVSGAKTDNKGNFFIGGLKEGVYVVQIDPQNLAVELSTVKTTAVAEVAGSAITRLDFPVRPEYGLAGRITDVAGKPMSDVRVELVNSAGAPVVSAMTDQFGLYRLDGVAAGKYTLQVPNQEGINNSITLPKLDVAISKEFVYDQNLRLPIAAAAKEVQEK
ncbi:carboxypeptidase regulatory-like domain-containing protein [Nostoc sp. FACHB-110]|uniref:carboxypeptidase regulatory-like domain-containing protein n=1 Tax=Nostoc sp. FACHB-110 TaxID=2692834 RepID=UPI001685F866|nr:carboxypeptidase regulatory-like domain-containing protein [Nostoc sp. FACHB-110]MBD2438630.1 carboxypeptidase regulatory-like domain-containing protein [Nostoc sp. FACHB-110]